MPPESFITEEDIVPDVEEMECEPMIVSVELSNKERLEVCPRLMATTKMDVGVEGRIMYDKSLSPMVAPVIVDVDNRQGLPPAAATAVEAESRLSKSQVQERSKESVPLGTPIHSRESAESALTSSVGINGSPMQTEADVSRGVGGAGGVAPPPQGGGGGEMIMHVSEDQISSMTELLVADSISSADSNDRGTASNEGGRRRQEAEGGVANEGVEPQAPDGTAVTCNSVDGSGHLQQDTLNSARSGQQEGRTQSGRRKSESGRRKNESGRRKSESGRRKSESGQPEQDTGESGHPKQDRNESRRVEQVSTESRLPEQVCTESGRPEQVSSEPRLPEQISSELGRPEQVSSESRLPEQGRPEQVSSELGRPEQVSSELGRPEQVSSESRQPEQVCTKLGRPEQVSSESRQPEQVSSELGCPELDSSESRQPEQVSSELGRPELDSSESARLEQVSGGLGRPELDSSESGQPEWVSTESGQLELVSTESGQTEQANTESGQPKLVSTESGQPELVSTESGRTELVSTESEQPEQVSTESGQTEQASTESGRSEWVSTELGQPEQVSSESEEVSTEPGQPEEDKLGEVEEPDAMESNQPMEDTMGQVESGHPEVGTGELDLSEEESGRPEEGAGESGHPEEESDRPAAESDCPEEDAMESGRPEEDAGELDHPEEDAMESGRPEEDAGESGRPEEDAGESGCPKEDAMESGRPEEGAGESGLSEIYVGHPKETLDSGCPEEGVRRPEEGTGHPKEAAVAGVEVKMADQSDREGVPSPRVDEDMEVSVGQGLVEGTNEEEDPAYQESGEPEDMETTPTNQAPPSNQDEKAPLSPSCRASSPLQPVSTEELEMPSQHISISSPPTTEGGGDEATPTNKPSGMVTFQSPKCSPAHPLTTGLHLLDEERYLPNPALLLQSPAPSLDDTSSLRVEPPSPRSETSTLDMPSFAIDTPIDGQATPLELSVSAGEEADDGEGGVAPAEATDRSNQSGKDGHAGEERMGSEISSSEISSLAPPTDEDDVAEEGIPPEKVQKLVGGVAMGQGCDEASFQEEGWVFVRREEVPVANVTGEEPEQEDEAVEERGGVAGEEVGVVTCGEEKGVERTGEPITDSSEPGGAEGVGSRADQDSTEGQDRPPSVQDAPPSSPAMLQDDSGKVQDTGSPGQEIVADNSQDTPMEEVQPQDTIQDDTVDDPQCQDMPSQDTPSQDMTSPPPPPEQQQQDTHSDAVPQDQDTALQDGSSQEQTMPPKPEPASDTATPTGPAEEEVSGEAVDSGLDLLVHAEAEDLSVFSSEAAEADQLQALSTGQHRKGGGSSSKGEGVVVGARQSSGVSSPSLTTSTSGTCSGGGAAGGGASSCSRSSPPPPSSSSSSTGVREKRSREDKPEVRLDFMSSPDIWQTLVV